MNLKFDKKLARNYKNPSQIARILTEGWVQREGYCPQCGKSLVKYKNNKPVGDFFCGNCCEDYELKSKKGNVGRIINDGAFHTMVERLNSMGNPNFFFLSYDPVRMFVKNFLIIPKHFFVQNIIHERKPTTPKGRNKPWIGCNISIVDIPQSGKIFYVRDGRAVDRIKVRDDWRKTLFLRETESFDSKGWILDVMNCLDRLGKKEFKLEEIYAFEKELSILHPKNYHVRDKIRQQLQLLRDKGYLDFLSKGSYRLK